MTSTTVDRIDGLTTTVAIKAPCVAATTANITLSGEQTIDGIACVTGNRVLVKNQTDTTQNGIWIVNTSSWSRAKDFDGTRDVTRGTAVKVVSGSANAGWWAVTTTGTITPGTSSISFSQDLVSDSSTITFLQSGTGAVARTVQDKERDVKSVFDCMTTAQKADVTARSLTIDVTTSVQAALTDHDSLVFQPGAYKITSDLTKTASSGTIALIGNGDVVLDMRTSTGSNGLLVGGSLSSSAALAGNVSAGGTSFTTTLSLSAGDVVEIVSTDAFSAASASFVKGEMCQVKSVSGGPTYTVNIDGALADSYTAATTTITKVLMPKVVIRGIQVLRDSNHTGLRVLRARDIDIENVKATGARDRCVEIQECFGGQVRNCYTNDSYYIGSGTSYGIVVVSAQGIDFSGNRTRSGRHGVAHGGTFPNRNIVWAGGNDIDNTRGLNLPAFDIHANAENILVDGNIIRNGLISDAVKNIVIGESNTILCDDYDNACCVNQWDNGTVVSIGGVIEQKKAASSAVVFTTSVSAATTLDRLAIQCRSIKATHQPIKIVSKAAAFTYTITRLDINGVVADAGLYMVYVVPGATATIAADINIVGGNYLGARGMLFQHVGDVSVLSAKVKQTTNATFIIDCDNTGDASVKCSVIDGAGQALPPKFENAGRADFVGNTVKNIGASGRVQTTSDVTVFFESNNNYYSITGSPTLGHLAYETGSDGGSRVTTTSGGSAPAAGTWALGDRCRNVSGTVGQPKGWVCTVAGTPGTWTSEGNL